MKIEQTQEIVEGIDDPIFRHLSQATILSQSGDVERLKTNFLTEYTIRFNSKSLIIIIDSVGAFAPVGLRYYLCLKKISGYR